MAEAKLEAEMAPPDGGSASPRNRAQVALSLIAFWLYGSALVALIPGVSPAGVSWIGHASGFAGGLLAALAVHRDSAGQTS